MPQILPASTLPTQIVLADRYVSGGGDPNQIDQQPWDASVQALARYPDVLKWMDDNLNWTTDLGQAFLNQQQDVMDSIQRLRQSAYQSRQPAIHAAATGDRLTAATLKLSRLTRR